MTTHKNMKALKNFDDDTLMVIPPTHGYCVYLFIIPQINIIYNA